MYLIWPSLGNKRLKKLGEKSWANHCRGQLDNPMFLHNVVATCSLQFNCRIGEPSEKQRLFLKAHDAQSKSLQLLREHTQKGSIDYKLIIGIWAAAVTSFAFCDLLSCRTHLQALKQILDDSKGYTTLSWDTVICILMWDLWSANMFLQRPIFSSKDWLDLAHRPDLSTPLSSASKTDKNLQQQLDDITTCLDSRLVDVSTSISTETHLRNHRAIVQLAKLADKTLLYDFHTAFRLYRTVQAYQGAIAITDLVLYHNISSSLQTQTVSPPSNTPISYDDDENKHYNEKINYQKSLDLVQILSVSYCHKIIALREPKGIMLCVPLHHLHSQILSLQQQQQQQQQCQHQQHYREQEDTPIHTTRSKRYAQINIMYACFIGSCVEQLVSQGYKDSLDSIVFTTTSWWHTREFLKLVVELQLEKLDAIMEIFKDSFLYSEGGQMDVFLKTALSYKSYL